MLNTAAVEFSMADKRQKYVKHGGHLGIQYGLHWKFKIMILLDSLTPKIWG